MAAREEADQQLIDRLALADDGAGHLLADRIAGGAEFLEALKIGVDLVAVGLMVVHFAVPS